MVGSGKPYSRHCHPVLPEGPETLTTEGPWSLASDPGSAQSPEGRRPLRAHLRPHAPLQSTA